MLRRVLTLAAVAALPAMALAASWTPTFSQSVIMGISMADANTGYIAGGDNGVGANVLKTTDGGRTFTSVPIAFSIMLISIAAHSETSACATGMGMLAGSNQYTKDGKRFTNSSEPNVSLQQTQDAQIIEGTDDNFAVTGVFSFFNSNNTINGVSVSRDGGATFTFSEVNADQKSAPARYGSFPSPKVAFVAAGDWPSVKARQGVRELTQNVHIHESRDGTSRLHLNKARRSSAIATDADEPNSGYVGVIYRSTDGMKTWQSVYTNTSFYFNQISCASELVCYVAAENDQFGYALRTLDGGETWKEVLKVSGVSIMALEAISEKEAYVGGGILSAEGINGTLYKTVDGGDSFQLEEIPGYYLTDLDVIDEDHKFATAMDSNSQSDVLIYA